MRTLSPADRRAMRAKAHHLHPVVIIGQHGLTPTVMHEVDVNLRAHELIKIRVFNDDRSAREQVLLQICSELDAAPVQHLGKLLVIWRPAPAAEAAMAPANKNKPSTTKRAGQRRSAGAAAPDARTGKPGSRGRAVPRGPAAGKKPAGRRPPRAASAAKTAPATGARRRRKTTP